MEHMLLIIKNLKKNLVFVQQKGKLSPDFYDRPDSLHSVFSSFRYALSKGFEVFFPKVSHRNPSPASLFVSAPQCLLLFSTIGAKFAINNQAWRRRR